MPVKSTSAINKFLNNFIVVTSHKIGIILINEYRILSSKGKKMPAKEGHVYTMTKKRSKEERYHFSVTIDTSINPYDKTGFKLKRGNRLPYQRVCREITRNENRSSHNEAEC